MEKLDSLLSGQWTRSLKGREQVAKAGVRCWRQEDGEEKTEEDDAGGRGAPSTESRGEEIKGEKEEGGKERFDRQIKVMQEWQWDCLL
jgi:hypothetical protein